MSPRLTVRPRLLVAASLVVGTVLGAGGVAVAAGLVPRPTDVVYAVPALADGSVNPDPFLAAGVGVGHLVPTYTASGTGPAARNPAAPAGSPARYIDYALVTAVVPSFVPTPEQQAAGALPAGMTITEAQGLNAMARVQENLAAAGLELDDLKFMRIYVDNPPGAATGDYNGWNRAYRKYVANVSRTTGQVIPAYAPVLFENRTRPARSNVEVATLPVAGWLVEIEAEAVYRR